MPDTAVAVAVGRGDEHVPETVGVPEHPRVAERFGAIAVEGRIPARIGDRDGVGRDAFPVHQILRHGVPDALTRGPSVRRDSGVEHAPHVAVPDHAARPDRSVVEASGRARGQCVGQVSPLVEVGRHGMAGDRVLMPQVGVSQ